MLACVSNQPQDHPVVDPGELVRVEDPRDPRLALYRDLNDPASRVRVDAEHGVFVVEGRLAVERLLTSGYAVQSLLVDDHQVTAASDLVAATQAKGARVFVGSRSMVAGTVGFPLHRGVVAIAERPPPTRAAPLMSDFTRAATLTGDPPIVAVLEGLNDHENIGALFRNAAAFGVAGVLLDPTCADPLYRRSIRVSVGHVLHLPFARLEPWPTGLRQVRDAGFVIASLTTRPAAGIVHPRTSLDELKNWILGPDYPVGVALLLGAEGRGLTEAALALSDLFVSIPMAQGVDSLNVATAAAIAFHAITSF
jgi:tRNA G18 (ribose-2'-O)-methylase SpoU